MQVDEEIGKVAQATPILICMVRCDWNFLTILAKAIEMFLQNLIDRIVEESNSQAHGKVTPYIV